jgi:hypothetical protein
MLDINGDPQLAAVQSVEGPVDIPASPVAPAMSSPTMGRQAWPSRYATRLDHLGTHVCREMRRHGRGEAVPKSNAVAGNGVGCRVALPIVWTHLAELFRANS